MIEPLGFTPRGAFPVVEEQRVSKRFAELIAEARTLRDGYLASMKGFLERLRRGCRQNNVDYVLIETSQSLDVALSKYLAARLAKEYPPKIFEEYRK